MKVLMPIYPIYIEEIFNGIKKYEFRRKIFKNKDVDTVVMYATVPVKKIVGEFKIKNIICDTPENLWKLHHKIDEESHKNFLNYLKDLEKAYAIEITDIKKYPNPLEIQELFPNLKKIPQSFMYIK